MQSYHKIKVFRSKNGMEFIFKVFERFLKDRGIEKQTSTRIGLNKTEWLSVQIIPSWRWQGTCSFSNPSQIILSGSVANMVTHKTMSNEVIGFHYVR